MNKRAVIYVFYDKDGIVDSYVTYMLQALKSVCDKLVVVCNGKLNDLGRQSLYEITEDIVVRENEGFDAWGFKTGIEYIGWDTIEQYDELVLMNDSVFGPIYPLQSIFDDMAEKELDFWGITKHGRFVKTYGKGNKEKVLPEHIQSYFIAVSKSMLSDPEFRKYWDNLKKLKTWNDAVSLFESKFTNHFESLGMKWDVYINTDDRYADFTGISMLSLMVYELIRDYRCPVIKRKNFSIEYDNFLAFSVGDNTRKAFDYIKENTEYDVDLIWDHILRTSTLRHINDCLNLTYLLPESYVLNDAVDTKNMNVAVFAHITYEDLIDFCAGYIKSASGIADVYITTLNEHTKECIVDRFGLLGLNEPKIIVLPENSRGRDVSALWVALKPYMTHYDYICYIHNKKSPQVKPLTVGRGFAERCFTNTLASKEYVINVLNLFAQNPRLGMLFPPPIAHGPYRGLISNLWTSNHPIALELAERFGIDVLLDAKIDPVFPAGGMFWFKTRALQKLIDYDIKYTDFPPEPLGEDGTISHAFERIYCFVAQSEGYYSAWGMTNSFASTEITTLSYLLARKHTKIWGATRVVLVNKVRKYMKLYLFLRFFYRIPKKIKKKLRGL